jgi:Na+-translocating ferredoxin:NAD+ oxidoreductase RNF subunit RnfB
MAKTLCDWSKKDIQSHPDKLARILCDPCFYCAKCARAANASKRLCKARRMPRVLAGTGTRCRP